jgi:hypothetical protein
MAVLKPRNRIFLIRLTQDEYDTLKTAGGDRGARSTSDFARSLLLTALGKGEGGEAGALAEVCRTLAGLREEVGRMAEKIGRMSPEETGFQGGKQS